MKAILQENDAEFERIHDLDILCMQCKDMLPTLENFRDELVKLSTYAVEVRYPGSHVSEKEAGDCVDIMIKVRKIIRNYFEQK